LLAWVGLVVAGAALVASPQAASAFCGTYVSGGESDLFNNATQVVMMRDGQQTVLSMQNNYQGPPKNFAMVIPTPQVLNKDDVKVVKDEVFDRIDRLTAPRLVEYWEQDPCRNRRRYAGNGGARDVAAGGADAGSSKVDVEAQFDVGEYEVVVLSSSESSALENWLRNNKYNIPKGASKYLQPYVQQGQYFFVAKVDTSKVQFQNGQAVLSPLRFHYQSQQFKLPVRLGLINSQGKQDLVVNILARNQRYRVANYPNATIPTNLRVKESVKGRFPSFYKALFKRTLKQNRKNGQNPVVTEYSWNASTCDPCPGPALDRSHFLTLGADVIFDVPTQGSPDAGRGPRRIPTDWTITRLHARYSQKTLGKDLVFEKAPAIRGGRGQPGNLQQGAQTKNASRNRFQGRYIITHPWDGPVKCDTPRYDVWGGKNGQSSPSTRSAPGKTNRQSKADQEVNLDDVLEPEGGSTGSDTGGSSGGETGGPPSDAGASVWSDVGSIGLGDGGGFETPGASGSGDDSGGGCSTTGGGLPIPLAVLAAWIGIGLLRRRD
jgi:uncharacterized protein (TIGR03382 family)